MLNGDPDNQHILDLILRSPHSYYIIDKIFEYLTISEQKILLVALNRSPLGKKLREVLAMNISVYPALNVPLDWRHWNIWCPSNKFSLGWKESNCLDEYRLEVWKSNILTPSEKAEIWYAAHKTYREYLFNNLNGHLRKELFINISTDIDEINFFKNIAPEHFDLITILGAEFLALWQYCNIEQRKYVLYKIYKGDWIKKLIQGKYNKNIPDILLKAMTVPWVEFQVRKFIDDEGKIDYFFNTLKRSTLDEFSPFLNSLAANPELRNIISSANGNLFLFHSMDKEILNILDDHGKVIYFLMRSKSPEEVQFKRDILKGKYGFKSMQMVHKVIHSGSIDFIEKTWPYITSEGKCEYLKLDPSLPKSAHNFIKRVIFGEINLKIQGIVNSLMDINSTSLLISIWEHISLEIKQELILSFVSSPIQRDFLKEIFKRNDVNEKLTTLKWPSLMASLKSNYHVGKPVYLYDIFDHIKDVLSEFERKWIEKRYSLT